MLSDRSILVTGANGFVGRHMVDHLRGRGARVRPCVREHAKESPDLDWAGLDPVAVGEIDGETDWTPALAGVDTVIHSAARVHFLRDTSENPLQAYLRVNTEGSWNLARQAVAAGVRRFVYVSSINVTGQFSLPGEPFTESTEPIPRRDYGRSKLQAEIALASIAEESDLELVVVRPPIVYGPHVRANFLRLLRAVHGGWPLPLGAIHNRRSCVGVRNLCDMLATCAHHPDAVGETFLVADAERLSTPELASRIGAAMGRRPRLIYVPHVMLRAGLWLLGFPNVYNSLCSSLEVEIGHARARLGWRPPYTIDEELAYTVDWFLRGYLPPTASTPPRLGSVR